MDIGTKIKSTLKEAEIYRTQGLLMEAKAKLEAASKLIHSIQKLKNKDQLIAGIKKKMKSLDLEIDRVENAPLSPEVEAQSQALIKKLFASTADKSDESVALEEAIALTKFGQYQKALEEFEALLEKDKVRLAAAKNIIRCHMARNTVDEGIAQFGKWQTGSLFDADQIFKLRGFFQNILDKKEIKKKLPSADEAEKKAAKAAPEQDKEEEILDINSIGLTFQTGSQKGEMVELDVSFQSGNVISVLISNRDKELVEHLNVGDELPQIQFYSPIAIFQGSGKVSAKTEIKVGPRKGDFSLDIKVSNT